MSEKTIAQAVEDAPDPREALMRALRKPFHSSAVEWVITHSGEYNGKPWAHCTPYLTARAVMDRLDDVLHPWGWFDTYEVHQDQGAICTLHILFPQENEWMTKADGAPQTDIEGFKGQISKALVRAAAKWGVGRYLYKFPRQMYVDIVEKGTPGASRYAPKGKKPFFWIPPDYDKELQKLNEPNTQQPRRGSAPAPERPPAAGEQAPAQDDELAALEAKAKDWWSEDKELCQTVLSSLGLSRFPTTNAEAMRRCLDELKKRAA